MMASVTYTTVDGRTLTVDATTKKLRGYAAKPGTGPADQTCGSCKHLHRNRLAKTYLKCALMKQFWTGGAGTDVLARSPACSKWEMA